MAYDKLRQQVLEANLALVDAGLVVLTWGNASGADRQTGVMAIKPSGISYDKLKADDIVVLSIKTGQIMDGTARPSSDTPTHLHLYREFPSINGVVHTHSLNATAFAQAQRPIPCFGTTHADNFYGQIPVTRELRPEEVETDYELNTGRVIVEQFLEGNIDPAHVPGVLVACHAPFAWGPTIDKAVENAIVLEFAAQMALAGLAIDSDMKPIPTFLLDKHFLRKHGPKAYYGQPKN
ncbi:MAG TPA: L-ribulose-5-phosphate 4-epimerase AraD [Tepidisphaeraceae bacterium]|nr:L-ribulose-5-phosphate 4-epimerase AraD [Tepidisphaeraceae bacterium]